MTYENDEYTQALNDLDPTISINDADAKKIFGVLRELCDAQEKIHSLKEGVKDILVVASKEYNIPKSDLSKLAKTYFKRSFFDETQKHKQFEALYTKIVGNK